MVASHTAVPMGTAVWLVWNRPQFYQPAFTVGNMSSPCPLPSGKVPGVGIVLPSHFEKPKGFSVWLATFV